MTRFSSFLKGSIAAVGVGVRSTATQAASSVPTITSGTGAPSASEPDGSLYLRTDGADGTTEYRRISSAWVASATASLASASVFTSTEQTGTGASQNVAHGFGTTPKAVVIYPSTLDVALAAGYVVTPGTHTSTNVVVTVTSGRKFIVVAFK